MAIAGKQLQEFINEENVKETHHPAYIPDLDIEMISPNPYQPRIEIRPESLMGLADSIRNTGILEPLLVTKKGENKYELIAGERRWRAAKIAKIPTVPVIIKEASPLQMLQLAIIENIHRKDLNPLEEGLAFEQLMNLFNMDHADIAKKIGCSRPVVTNKVRLLTLPDNIKKLLLEDKISEGHARAMLGLSDPDVMLATANIVIRDRLSVRQVEELVRRLNEGQTKKYNTKAKIENDVFSKTLEQNLQTHFNTTVKLARGLRGGKIIIQFKDDEDLKRIAARIL